MAHRHSDLQATGEAGHSLRQVYVGEAIDVRVGVVGFMADVEPLLATGDVPSRGADFTLVLVVPGGIASAKAIRTLQWLEDAGHTLVLTASESDGPLRHAVALAATQCPGQAGGGGRVLIEPDAERAVIGGLQCMHSGDAFWVVAVGGGDRDVAALRTAVDRGIGWRAAWDEPENGEFHRSARGPDGAPVLPDTPAGGGWEQGGSS